MEGAPLNSPAYIRQSSHDSTENTAGSLRACGEFLEAGVLSQRVEVGVDLEPAGREKVGDFQERLELLHQGRPDVRRPARRCALSGAPAFDGASGGAV